MKSALVIAIVAGSLAGLVCLYSLSREAKSAGSIAPKPVDRRPDRVAADEGAKRALLQLAKVNWSHSEKLLERRSVSQEERDRDYLTMVRAQAELDEAAAERAQVEAPARADEVAEAEGRVAAAEAKL